MNMEIYKNNANNEICLDDNSAYLDDVVAEYVYLRERVTSAFLFGIISMGAILYTHRDRLKKIEKWTEFCQRIGLHISQANQQIRMYELSVDNSRIDVLKKTITNWAKLNMFMSLDDSTKDEILNLAEQGIISPNTSSSDFKEIIGDIKNVDITEDIPEVITVADTYRNPLHEDNKMAAELIRKAVGMEYSSKPFLEAYSCIQKGIDILRGESKYPKENENDLRSLMESQISSLANILGELTNE